MHIYNTVVLSKTVIVHNKVFGSFLLKPSETKNDRWAMPYVPILHKEDILSDGIYSTSEKHVEIFYGTKNSY